MTPRPPSRHRLLLSVLAVLAAASAPVLADDPPARPAADPAATALLGEVAAAYRALPGYRDEGRFTAAMTVNGVAQEQVSAVPLAFERPNRFALEHDGVRVVSDGKQVLNALGPLKTYFTTPAPAKINPGTLGGGPLGAMLLGSPAQGPLVVVFSLLADDQAVERLAGLGAAPSLEPDRTIDGRTLKVLRLEQGPDLAYRLLVDPGSKLLRRVEVAVPPAALQAKAPPKTTITDLTLAWDSGAIQTDAPPAETFATAAPAGFARVKPAEPPAEAAGGQHALVGKPAPEFTLSVVEGDKTRKLTAADLAGKVVLLDFWATWCPPCREELPELQALAGRLAKSKADKVLIVAVSQDRNPDDGGLRPLIDKTLADLKVNLVGGPVLRLALDPDQLVGDAFGVEALPTLVLLDATGTVRAVHVGYEPGIGERIEADIAALIAGKPIGAEAAKAQPKAKPGD